MKIRRIGVMAGAVVAISATAVTFRHSVPFYPAANRFAQFNLPFHRAYWTLTEDAGLCPLTEVFAGLGEHLRTEEASEWAANHTRLRERDPLGLELWETPYGDMWFPNSIEPRFVHFTTAQFKIEAYPGIPIRKGDVVIDCGGFVGDWTKFALEEGASQVVIVEPAREQLECIRRNLAEPIRQGRVIVYPKGVWDREERLYLRHNTHNPAGHKVSHEISDAGEWIELTTIDKMIAELGLQRVDVIKMDIEGAESRAVRGARETLNRFRPRLAVATEHTTDKVKNNRDVIQAVREVAPFYNPRCGYCSPTGKGLVVPQTLYFVQ